MAKPKLAETVHVANTYNHINKCSSASKSRAATVSELSYQVMEGRLISANVLKATSRILKDLRSSKASKSAASSALSQRIPKVKK